MKLLKFGRSKGDKADKAEKAEKVKREKAEKAEREKAEKAEKAEREKAEKAQKAEKDKAEKEKKSTEKTAKPEATKPDKAAKKPNLTSSKSHYHLSKPHPTPAVPSPEISRPKFKVSARKKSVIEAWNEAIPSVDQPSFKDVAASDRPALFLTKLKACQRIFVWEDGVEPDDDPQWAEKEKKRIQLEELVDYINQNPRDVFNEGNLREVVDFVSVNMFRSFLANPTPPNIIYDPEEDEPLLDPSWPHLQFVMEFFLRFIVSPDVDPKVAKKYIDQTFITNLLSLFDSEDVRERDFLKTILHRIYGKFMQHRSFIRKAINNTFYHFIYNTERHNGIAELLEILGSIINGFALPLKLEHKVFLRKSLLPLHKAKYLSTFHSQLSYCITQFCEKDPQLVVEVILGLLKFWPQTNSPKAVLFLQEVEDILQLTQPAEFEIILEPLFRRLSACIMSTHFQVAERTLLYWHDDFIVGYITHHQARILPIIFPALMKNVNSHWNATVLQLTTNVVDMFNEMNPTLFDECANSHKLRLEKESIHKIELKHSWESLRSTVLSSAPGPPGWKAPCIDQPSVLDPEEKNQLLSKHSHSAGSHVLQAKPLSTKSQFLS